MGSDILLISAGVVSGLNQHRVTLSTAGKSHSLAVPPRGSGSGSSANGGELLCLALATCFCNDIYREASKRLIEVVGVEVQANAEFGGEGQPARRLSYSVSVLAKASEAAIRDLITHTDKVAEVHNTLRLGIPVVLEAYKAEAILGDDAA